MGDPGRGRSVCARCHGPFRAPHAIRICEDGIALDEAPLFASATGKPFVTSSAPDDWQLRQRTRALGRQLRREGGGPPTLDGDQDSHRRLDPPQDVLDELHDLTASPIIMPTESVTERRKSSPRRPEGGQFAAWGFAAAGATLLGGGIGTIVWALAADRPDLWNLAVGTTLAGQGLLIFGLVMLVARLWRTSRHAADRLHTVHTELGQLQRTADALTAMRSGGAPAFYAELVRGASPQMLLANLKGQLDQLATRLSGQA